MRGTSIISWVRRGGRQIYLLQLSEGIQSDCIKLREYAGGLEGNRASAGNKTITSFVIWSLV